MIDIGWSEMAVIALIALVVLGPKELPRVMRAAAKWIRKARVMAREFQTGVDDMIREADLEDARKALDATRDLNVGKIIEEAVDPTGTLGEEVREIEGNLSRAKALEENAGASDDNAQEDAEGGATDPGSVDADDDAEVAAEGGATDPGSTEGDERVTERASNP